ncbi:MAG: tRNA 2-thiouridine(34) synthase MnmA [Emergencia sp.]
MSTLKKNKVILGLSGGVDSTTAALLLKEQGFSVTGFYFDVTGDNKEGEQAARSLAQRLEIPFISMNVAEEFDRKVIGNFCSEYACGRTPNPCIICNPLIKFRRLLETADREGAYYVATGHYARVAADGPEGPFYIRKGASERKDQSYMLYRLGQDVLSRLILPLGDFEDKERTREIARTHDLPNADASDSQEICFIDEKKESYGTFLERRGIGPAKGCFVDAEGRALGPHKGAWNYTIGQRKGLGIALGRPAFVTRIDPDTGNVTLGDNEDLFSTKVFSKDNFFAETSGSVFPGSEGTSLRVYAKIRYASKPAPAAVTMQEDGRLLTVFDVPQRAAAPGQSIVFYDGDRVIGGGFID